MKILANRTSSPPEPTAALPGVAKATLTGGASRRLVARCAPFAVLIAIVAVATRGLWLNPGVPLFGDFIPPTSHYVEHVSSVWDPLEHNGTISIDFRSAPLFVPLGLLAGDSVETLRFTVVTHAFLIAVVLLAVMVPYSLMRRVLQWPRTGAVVGAVVLGMNPWVAAQVAAGHFGVLLGYDIVLLVAVTAMCRQGLRFSVTAGTLTALALSLDVHSAIICGGIVVVGRLLRRDALRARLRDAAASACFAVIGSLFWALPTLAAVQRMPYKPGSISESTAAQATLAQNGDIFHVLMARSIWYPPFAQDLFDFGAFSGVVQWLLLLIPVLLLVRAALGARMIDTRARLIGLLLVVVGVVPQFAAHYASGSYAALTNLPLGAAFRDPSEFTPLYILGLCALAAAVRPWYRVEVALMSLGCLAVLSPWASGNLRGDLQPVNSAAATVAAVQWIHQHATADDRVLWLPVDLYVKYPGAAFEVNDPVRFWSSDHLLNPAYDPAYDFAPETTSGLINLQWLMERPLPGRTLVNLLAKVGVRFVAVRANPGIADSAIEADSTLRVSEGFHVAQNLPGLRIYAADSSPRPTVSTSAAVSLFDGGWQTLAGTLPVDPDLSRVYVPLQHNSPALLSHQNTSVSLRSSVTDAVFGLANLSPPTNAVGRYTYPFDPGLGYVYYRGETVGMESRGIAAFRILAGNADVSFSCNSQPVAAQSMLALPQPEVTPRWVAFSCSGHAAVHVDSTTVLVQGTETETQADFARRANTVWTLLGHDGSSYTLGGPASGGSDLISLTSTAPDTPTTATRLESPVLLPQGSYQFMVVCHPSCGGTVTVAPIETVTQGGTLTGSLPPVMMPTGRRTVVRVEGGPTAVGQAVIASGAYQLLLRQIPFTAVERVVIVRLPIPQAHPTSAPQLANGGSTHLPGATAVAVNQAPGPWWATTAAGDMVPSTPADVLGSAFLPPGGAPFTVSLATTTLLEGIGVAASAGLMLAFLAVEGRRWWRLPRRSPVVVGRQ